MGIQTTIYLITCILTPAFMASLGTVISKEYVKIIHKKFNSQNVSLAKFYFQQKYCSNFTWGT